MQHVLLPSSHRAGAARFWGGVLLAMWCLLPALASAGTSKFSSEPFLRLNPETHTAPIRRISVDKRARFVASGAHDKTVRVWDLETGRLAQVLRIPLGPGSLGKVYAVALSPDGATVAVSGFTGMWTGEQSIYIFDRQSGRLAHRIEDLPSSIGHLAYSPDGHHLAAMLGGANGLRVYETSRYREVGKDADYGASAYWADFDANDRLVTTSYDGDIRLYEGGDFSKPRLRRAAPGGQRPFGIAFSPDGQSIAVGYGESTRVDVLSAKTLEHTYSPDTARFKNGSLLTVAWSADGRYLYAGGEYDESGLNPVIRWSAAGRGDIVKHAVANTTVMGIQPLADGRLVIGASDPLLALLDTSGNALWNRASKQADFRSQEGRGDPGLKLSRTGDVIEFGFKVSGKQRARFDLSAARLELEPTSDTSLAGPSLSAPGLTVTDWDDEEHPKLNGKALELKEFEMSRALAITPDQTRVVLGTEWSLRVYDANGSPLDKKAVPGVAWAVNITPDGRKVVAGLGDGTLRWYALSRDGTLSALLALYALPDGRWVLWTPSGYYHAAAGAEDLIGWHLNNGADQTPEFFPVSRFREQFYRPDVIAQVLKTGDEGAALRLADKARGEQTVLRDVKSLRPPVIAILAPAPGEQVSERKLTLMYEAQSETGAITTIEARVGARSARVLRHHPTYRDKRRSVIGQITVELPPADTVVELLAHNSNGSSESARYAVNWSGAADYFKPDLYVLAIGISDYPGEQQDLAYAAKDARDFVRAIRQQQGELYRKVHVKHLDDRDATHAAILKGLNWIERETTSRDVAIVFLAGHGVNDAKGRYRFLPADYDQTQLKLTSVKGADFREYLESIAGKTFLFFDTCYSGNALDMLAQQKLRGPSKPDVDRVANELADAQVGVIVFASTTGGDFARGLKSIKQGAFTKALLEAIEAGKADFTKDFFISIAELEKYVSDRVKTLTKGEQKPVTTKPQAIQDWNFIRVPG